MAGNTCIQGMLCWRACRCSALSSLMGAQNQFLAGNLGGDTSIVLWQGSGATHMSITAATVQANDLRLAYSSALRHLEIVRDGASAFAATSAFHTGMFPVLVVLSCRTACLRIYRPSLHPILPRAVKRYSNSLQHSWRDLLGGRPTMKRKD